jgi:hypothetical protein
MRRWVAFLLSGAVGALVLAAVGLRFDRHDHERFLVGQVLILGGLIALTAWAALSRGRRSFGISGRVVWAVAFGALGAFAFSGLFWVPPTGRGALGKLGPIILVLPCFVVGMAAGAPMLFACVWALRRHVVVGALARGAALGTSVGLAAAVVLILHCGIPFGGHVVVAHGLPIVALAMLGGLAGGKLLRI